MMTAEKPRAKQLSEGARIRLGRQRWSSELARLARLALAAEQAGDYDACENYLRRARVAQRALAGWERREQTAIRLGQLDEEG